MAVKNIVFDIGNVLMDFDWKVAERYTREQTEVINEGIWYSGIWNELDRGTIDGDEALAIMKERQPEYADLLEDAFENAGLCIHRCDYAIPWIEEMRARGYGVYFLSNYSQHTMDLNREALDFLPHLDGGVFSCDVKLVKPDREIYECFAEKCGVKLEECLFLDDNAANVKASIEAGMPSLRFTNYEEMHEKVDRYLRD